MSVKIMGKAWELDLETSELLVLLAMADHADHEGNNVRPSTRLIAWKTGFSERHVRRVIDKLVTDTILIIQNAPKGKTITYRIIIENGKQKPPLTTPDKVSVVKIDTPDTVSPPPLTSKALTPDITVSPESLEPSIKPNNAPALKAQGDSVKEKTSALKTENPKTREQLIYETISQGSFGKPYTALNGQNGRCGKIREQLTKLMPEITPEYLREGYRHYLEAHPEIKHDPRKRLKSPTAILDWCEQAASATIPELAPPNLHCPKCHGRGVWIDKSDPEKHKSIDCECRSNMNG